MEEVSRMFDLKAVLKTPWEEAGYVTRKMLTAAAEAEAKIVQNILSQGIPPETVAVITKLEIEKVREIAEKGKQPVD
jgi:hypothetical protein